MSGELETAAVTVLAGIAQRNGVQIDVAALVPLAEQWIARGVDLLDGHAKAQAAAAGDAAASKVTTLEEAEASAKNR